MRPHGRCGDLTHSARASPRSLPATNPSSPRPWGQGAAHDRQTARAHVQARARPRGRAPSHSEETHLSSTVYATRRRRPITARTASAPWRARLLATQRDLPAHAVAVAIGLAGACALGGVVVLGPLITTRTGGLTSPTPPSAVAHWARPSAGTCPIGDRARTSTSTPRLSSPTAGVRSSDRRTSPPGRSIRTAN